MLHGEDDRTAAAARPGTEPALGWALRLKLLLEWLLATTSMAAIIGAVVIGPVLLLRGMETGVRGRAAGGGGRAPAVGSAPAVVGTGGTGAPPGRAAVPAWVP